jgi:3-phenylpropionate/cinnamic acid dioxygenase small subunit
MDAVVKELVDRQEIAAVLVSYARHVDKRDFDSLVALFTEDAVANYQGPELRGRAELETFFRESLSGVEATHHQIGNIEIEFEGEDRARARCYATAWHAFPDGEELTLHGTYLDVLERTPVGWKLAERRPKGSRHETRKLLARFAPDAASQAGNPDRR